MNGSRLDDMLQRYGECVGKTEAAAILGVTRLTIYRMIEDGRLREVCGGAKVDVRSICEYIESPKVLPVKRGRKKRERTPGRMEIVV